MPKTECRRPNAADRMQLCGCPKPGAAEASRKQMWSSGWRDPLDQVLQVTGPGSVFQPTKFLRRVVTTTNCSLLRGKNR